MHRLGRLRRLWSVCAVLAMGSVLLPTASAAPATTAQAWPGEARGGMSRTFLPDGGELLVGSDERVSDEVRVLHAGARELRFKLITARAHHSATLLPNGLVLIWGGIDSTGGVVSTAEVFDPESGSVRAYPRPAILARAGHTATVRTDGRVLFAGGWMPELGAVGEMELWDPRTNISELLKSVLTPATIGHEAVLLASDAVSFTGGTDGQGRRRGGASLLENEHLPILTLEGPAAGQGASFGQTEWPELAGSIPAAGADGVAVDAILGLRFSALMVLPTLSPSGFTLLGAEGEVEVRVVGAEAGRLAFVSPRRPLLPGARYTLVIQGAHDVQGRSVKRAVVTFTTAALGSGNPVSSGRSPNSTEAALRGDEPSAGRRDVPDSAPVVETWVETGTGVSKGWAECKRRTDVGREAAPCRELTVDEDGFWRPGKRNADNHWRTDRSLPPLPQAPSADALKLAAHERAVFGQVLRVDDRPLPGVEIALGQVRTRTKADGSFVLRNPPAGHQVLRVNGRTASAKGVEYLRFQVAVSVAEQGVTALSHHIFMPRVSERDKVSLPSPTRTAMVITHPEIPGLEVHIPADTVFLDQDGNALTQFAIVPTPLDRAPFPVARNVPGYFMLDPGGAKLQSVSGGASKGVRVVYPNFGHAAPGTPSDFWVYQPDARGWMVYGSGRVTADGRQIMPDPGTALFDTMGFMQELRPTIQPPPKVPPVCGAKDGDPVDCRTGVFIHQRKDLFVNDLIPLEVLRTYVSRDQTDADPRKSRSFGFGTSLGVDMYVFAEATSASAGYKRALILPDGSRVNFALRGTWNGANTIWDSLITQGPFVGATLSEIDNIDWPGFPITVPTGYPWLISTKDGTQYLFDSDKLGRLIGIKDREGNSLAIYRNNNSLPTQMVGKSGRTITFTANAEGFIAAASDGLRTIKYDYCPATGAAGCPAGYLKTVTYPDTTTEAYTYEADGDMLTVKDRNGKIMIENTYNAATGRVDKQVLAKGTLNEGTFTFSYFEQNGAVVKTIVTNPVLSKREIIFHASGYPLQETLALGTPEQEKYVYFRDAAGRLQSLEMPVKTGLTRTDTYGYDTRGNLTTVTLAAGTVPVVKHTLSYTTDYNQPLVYTDPMQRKTTAVFGDVAKPWRATKITDPAGRPTTLAYYGDGLLKSVTDPNTRKTTYTYDGADLASIKDNLGNTTIIGTDLIGRPTLVRDPLDRVVRIQYNDVGRSVKFTDAQGAVTTYWFTPDDQLAQVKDANNNVTRYTYNARGWLERVTDPANKSEIWTYYADGTVKTYTDRRAKLSQYQYDPLGRVETITWAGGATTTLTYEARDRLVKINDSSRGVIDRTYDVYDRLTLEKSPQGQVAYAYFADGRRQSMTVQGQPAVTYAYYPDGRLQSVTQGTAKVTYDYYPAGQRKSTLLANGVLTEYGYDLANRLSVISYKKGAALLGNLSYQYNAAGEIIERNGSWAPAILPTETPVMTYGAGNRLTAYGAVTMQYDANGNLTNDGARTYQYGVRNELESMTYPGGGSASFVYDALGRRVRKTVGGVTTSYLHDGFNVVREQEGTQFTSLLNGPGIDEVHRRGNRDFLSDGLGSTIALTDATGAVKTRYDYEPYGTTVPSGAEPAANNPYRYTGRERDATGLDYYRARYYHSAFRRFVAEDPIGIAGGVNVYSYVGARPLMYRDPSGKIIVGPLITWIGGWLGVEAGQLALWAALGELSEGAMLALGQLSGTLPSLGNCRMQEGASILETWDGLNGIKLGAAIASYGRPQNLAGLAGGYIGGFGALIYAGGLYGGVVAKCVCERGGT